MIGAVLGPLKRSLEAITVTDFHRARFELGEEVIAFVVDDDKSNHYL